MSLGSFYGEIKAVEKEIHTLNYVRSALNVTFQTFDQFSFKDFICSHF